MDFEQTDQEQIEALHKWWKENWMALVGGLVIGLGGILGWDFYQNWQKKEQLTASGHFETVRSLIGIDKTADATDELSHLREEAPKSPYSSQASFVMAKSYADAGEWELAAQQLEWVMNNGHPETLRPVARLRLARVRWAQGNLPAALDLLEGVEDASLMAIAAELRGDIHRQAGNEAAARAAYAQALNDAVGSIDRGTVQRKLDDLPQQSS